MHDKTHCVVCTNAARASNFKELHAQGELVEFDAAKVASNKIFNMSSVSFSSSLQVGTRCLTEKLRPIYLHFYATPQDKWLHLKREVGFAHKAARTFETVGPKLIILLSQEAEVGDVMIHACVIAFTNDQ